LQPNRDWRMAIGRRQRNGKAVALSLVRGRRKHTSRQLKTSRPTTYAHKWGHVAFGSSQEARARSNVLSEVREVPAFAAAPAGLQVRVPSLHATFIARRVGGGLPLSTPITSAPKLGIEAGTTDATEEVLLRMQSAAQKLDPNELN
jgi:hypothetical protein